MNRPRRPGRRTRRQRAAPERAVETVRIDRLALQGDGEGRLEDGTRVFVPLALPGDVLVVRPRSKRGDGVVGEVIEPLQSEPRAEHICEYFGTCGGCQLQHVPKTDYAAWKADVVKVALKRHGLTPPMNALRSVPVQSRRRATLAAVMTANGPVLGFNAAQSDRVIDIAECPLLVGPLNGLLASLRSLLSDVLTVPSRADVALTMADEACLEVVILSETELDLAARERIAAFAEIEGVARIAWGRPGESPEPVTARHSMTHRIAGVPVSLPIAAFLQPSVEGENILRDLVINGIGTARRVADLFCGIGTFSLALAAAGRHVLAVDSLESQARTLEFAAGQASLGGRIDVAVRDLRERPLRADELLGMEAVVFDPPRAGAKTQAECIAESEVPVVVAVSCNPSTLARDLRILVDGGYVLDHVTPVDQFPMSYHVEAVASLHRPT